MELAVGKEFRDKLISCIAAGKSIPEIRPLLVGQLESGVGREELYKELVDVILIFREEGNEINEDRAADVADLMTEWMPPDLRL